MRVNEIFYSIQGEGRYIGTPALFIRLQGCNLRCSFCDTKYTWDVKGGEEISLDELITIANKYNHVVITGGEPLLQSKELRKLLGSLEAEAEVETNGTLFFKDLVGFAHYNISPKLDFWNKYYKRSIDLWNRSEVNKDFKFVIRDYSDYTKVNEIVDELNLENVILMPEGVEPDRIVALTKKIIEWVKQDNKPYRVIPRLHILLYENKRGY